MGLGVIRDYREFQGDNQARGRARKPPVLMGSTFERSLKREGTLAAKVFHGHSNPRFGFRSGEREILQAALKGETDAGTARLLGLSLAAVKKRWQGLFNRVEGVDPDLLAEVSTEKSPPLEGRGGQHRRRRLLHYLRDHPEEWRAPSPGAPKKTRRS
jgi:hypothetical protein